MIIPFYYKIFIINGQLTKINKNRKKSYKNKKYIKISN